MFFIFSSFLTILCSDCNAKLCQTGKCVSIGIMIRLEKIHPEVAAGVGRRNEFCRYKWLLLGALKGHILIFTIHILIAGYFGGKASCGQQNITCFFSSKCIDQAHEKYCAIAKGTVDHVLTDDILQLTINGQRHVSSMNKLRKLEQFEKFTLHDSFKHHL